MKTEIEAKFLDVDFDELRTRLAELGGICEQPMRLMRRTLVDLHRRTPEENYSSFVRLRDEGDKVTLAYKEFHEKNTIGAVEREVVVGDFDDTKAILDAMGVQFTTFQETKRETWRVGDTEVVLDEWPWIPPHIEIEGPSEQAIRGVAEDLGYDWDDAVFGNIDVIYTKHYPNKEVRGVIDIPEVRFSDPVPASFRPDKV